VDLEDSGGRNKVFGVV